MGGRVLFTLNGEEGWWWTADEVLVGVGEERERRAAMERLVLAQSILHVFLADRGQCLFTPAPAEKGLPFCILTFLSFV